MKLLSDQELREATIRDYTRAAQSAGLPADRETIEKRALADLQLVDAARRMGELRGGPKRLEPGKERDDRQALHEAARADGMQVVGDVRGRGEIYRSTLLHGNPLLTDETWSRACARLKRILEGARGATLAGAAATAGVPKLARQWVETWALFMTRGRPPRQNKPDVNPFRGLSDEDADRMLRRKVEDICDQSTGALGAWRTPK